MPRVAPDCAQPGSPNDQEDLHRHAGILVQPVDQVRQQGLVQSDMGPAEGKVMQHDELASDCLRASIRAIRPALETPQTDICCDSEDRPWMGSRHLLLQKTCYLKPVRSKIQA